MKRGGNLAGGSKQTLAEYVAEQIRGQILERKYTAGSKLPNEFELAEEFGVCRYTVREAVKKLAATGLVEVRRGRGTYVNEMIPANYFKPMMDNLILEDWDVKEIFEVRIVIEAKTSELAAANAVQEDIREMEAILTAMEEALADNNIHMYNNLDFKFHGRIAMAGKNRLLCEIVKFLQDFIRFTIEESAVSMEKHKKSLAGHYRILECVKAGKPGAASEAMREHLTHCSELYR